MCIHVNFFLIRLENSTAENFISNSYHNMAMESDRFMPGYLLYSEQYALMTSNGIKSQLLAGYVQTSEYVEGVGAEARFSYIIFTQISNNVAGCS